MKKEIIEHVKNLKEQGVNVKIDEDQINDLVNRIFDKIFDKKDQKDKKDEKDLKKLYIRDFFKKYDDKISVTYGENKLSTEEINSLLKKYEKGLIKSDELVEKYNKFIINAEKLNDVMKKRKQGAITPKQKKIYERLYKRIEIYWLLF